MKSLAAVMLALMLAAPAIGFAQEAISPDQQVIVDKLSKLDGNKLAQLFSHLGIAPSAEFLDCLCPGEYGFHYFTAGPAGTSCRRIGPLGGTEFRGLATERMGSCSIAYPLADGGTVLGKVAEAAKPKPSCPARQSEPMFASALNYEVFPTLLRGVDPSRIIYLLSAEDRAVLAAVGTQLIAITDRMTGALVDAGAYTATTGIDFIKAAGHHPWTAFKAGKVDARIEFAGGELGFTFDPKQIKFVPTEVVLKIPVLGTGQNFEIAGGIEDRSWNGKIKVGYSNEALEGMGMQAEAKFGFEYDTRAIIDTSVIDDPKAYKVLPPGTLLPWNVGIERFLAGIDFYGGGAIGGKAEVLGEGIVGGPEVTWSVKEIYSAALVDDMMTGLDNVLVQQKALEEARHEYIRRLAKDYGVAGSECLSLTEVMVALQDRIRHLAVVNHIPYEGRTFGDIRKDLEKLPKQ